MPFPTNPSNNDVHIFGNKYFIYKENIGWIQQEPTTFFAQPTKPTEIIDSSRIAIWFDEDDGVIYFWENNNWIPYFSTKCT